MGSLGLLAQVGWGREAAVRQLFDLSPGWLAVARPQRVRVLLRPYRTSRFPSWEERSPPCPKTTPRRAPRSHDSEHQRALKLPLLEVAGHPPRIKRATLIVDHERVVREVMYPVPDPGANAAEAMAAVAKRVGG